MERISKQSVETSTRFYEKQIKEMEEKVEDQKAEDGDELFLRSYKEKVKKEEWKFVGYGPYMRRVKKSRIPPALFLRAAVAAVRPFTYKDLVKEIVLTRHAILDCEIKLELNHLGEFKMPLRRCLTLPVMSHLVGPEVCNSNPALLYVGNVTETIMGTGVWH
ncbi:hypothetical protein RJ641_000104 [Dillenia turbinata]|uniref:Uncharacterized protein n=1 Tax=Dillenia turbinata TaxID=194707 RepID=A0AAN8WES9_9MAGN